MKTKKLLGMLLALTMIFSMVIIPQAVVNADYSDNVLLEYDFENYTGLSNFGEYDDSKVTLGATGGYKNLKSGETSDGNTYMYTDVQTTNKARIQPKFSTAISTGKYLVSFDLGRGELDGGTIETTNDYMQVRDQTASSNGPRYFIYASASEGKIYGSTGTAKDANAYVDFNKNQIYRIDILIDLDNEKVASFVDGKLLKEFTGYTKSITTLDIFITWSIGYFDNLKIATTTNTSFEATAKYANKAATISFTESLLAGEAALSAADFVVTNAATGEAVAVATATKTAYDEVELAFADGAIKKGFTYNVAFSTNVKNIAGNAVTSTASFALPAEEQTAYIEEFSEFSDSEIVLENYEDLAYNDFRLLANNAWLTNSKWEGKRPFSAVQAIADGTDDKAIRIIRGERPTSTETFSDAAVTLPHKVYFEGEVSVEYRIKASSDLNSFIPYLIAKKNASSYQISGGSSIPTVRFDGNSVKYSETTYKHNGTFNSYRTDVDADRTAPEYHTYKAVYNFDTEKADIYFDGTKLNTEPLEITNYYHTSDGKADGTPAYIKDVGYFDRIDMRINGTNNSAYADIDYIKVTQTSAAPYVKGITYKDYQGNAADATTAGIKEIAVSFGGNVSEASLENITILDGENPVAYNGKFDAATRTYTMTIPGLLAGEKTYTLGLAAVEDPYGAAIVGEKEFAIATTAGTKGDLTVTFSKALAEIAAGDKVEITATIIDTTGAAAENYALIGAVNNGITLSDVDLVTLTWNGCVGTAKANVTVDSLTDVSVKAFVLESLGTLAPVAGSPFALN